MSAARLALHQLRFDQKTFWRNPAAVFFTVALPLIFLVIFSTVFGNEPIEELGGITTVKKTAAGLRQNVFWSKRSW